MINWAELTEREKTVLVAEKVLGWHLCEEGALYWETETTIESKVEDFDPLTSWDSMRLVVEEMRGRGKGIVIWPTKQGRFFAFEDLFDENYGNEYWFDGERFRSSVEEGYDWALADTAPEAVSLVALRACGVEVEV